MKNSFKILFLYLIELSLFISCQTKISETHNTINTNKEKLELKTFYNNDKIQGWGYDIYKDGVLYVHQPIIPVINGEKGFKTEEEAKKVGEFVINKIKNNITPPSISLNELDSLNIVK